MKELILNEIKFNRNYKKLHNQKEAVLVWCEPVKGKDLCKDFIKYDTEGEFPIYEQKDYLWLVFYGNKRIPFTTLRTDDVENRMKYLAGNKKFKIVVEGKKEEEPLPNHWVPM